MLNSYLKLLFRSILNSLSYASLVGRNGNDKPSVTTGQFGEYSYELALDEFDEMKFKRLSALSESSIGGEGCAEGEGEMEGEIRLLALENARLKVTPSLPHTHTPALLSISFSLTLSLLCAHMFCLLFPFLYFSPPILREKSLIAREKCAISTQRCRMGR